MWQFARWRKGIFSGLPAYNPALRTCVAFSSRCHGRSAWSDCRQLSSAFSPLSITIATALHANAQSATAKTIIGEIGRADPPATESRLAALAAPTDADGFALGGVHFLTARVLATLRPAPDAGRLPKVPGNFLAMIAENRQFWRRVALETDDQQEWLPNDAQHSALGVELPAQTGAQWLTVLAELEIVLKDAPLLPSWRAGQPAGIILAKIFSTPRQSDVAGWIQSWDALPYLQRGKVASLAGVEAFDSFVSGNAMLFSLYLN